MSAEQWAAGRKVFNLFGETVETTARQLVDRMLADPPNGSNVHLLPGWKMAAKAVRGLFLRRDLFAGYGV